MSGGFTHATIGTTWETRFYDDAFLVSHAFNDEPDARRRFQELVDEFGHAGAPPRTLTVELVRRHRFDFEVVRRKRFHADAPTM